RVGATASLDAGSPFAIVPNLLKHYVFLAETTGDDSGRVLTSQDHSAVSRRPGPLDARSGRADVVRSTARVDRAAFASRAAAVARGASRLRDVLEPRRRYCGHELPGPIRDRRARA